MFKKYLKQSFFFLLFISGTEGRIQIYPCIQIYPSVLPYNLDPFVVSETRPDNFSLVEDDSKPHDMWFSEIHADKRSIKLCTAHSRGSMLPNRLLHPVGSRSVDAWSSSELQRAVCLCVSSVEMKQNERVAINTHRSSVQVPHVSFMQMQLRLLPMKETLPQA